METLIRIIKNFFLNNFLVNKKTTLTIKMKQELMEPIQNYIHIQEEDLQLAEQQLIRVNNYINQLKIQNDLNTEDLEILNDLEKKYQFVKNEIDLIKNHSLPAITKYLEEFPKQNEIIYYKGVNSEKYNITNVLESEIDVKIKQKLVVLRWPHGFKKNIELFENVSKLTKESVKFSKLVKEIKELEEFCNQASKLVVKLNKNAEDIQLMNMAHDDCIYKVIEPNVKEYYKMINPSLVIVYNNKEYFTKEKQEVINVVLPDRVENYSNINFLQARMLREAELKKIVNNERVLIKEVNEEVEKKVLVQGRDESNVEFVKRQKLAEETLEFSKKTWGGLYYDILEESDKNLMHRVERFMVITIADNMDIIKNSNDYTNLEKDEMLKAYLATHKFSDRIELSVSLGNLINYRRAKATNIVLVEEKFKNFKEFAPKEVSKITNTEEKKINCCMEEQIELLSIISLVIIIGVLLISILGGLIYWKKNKKNAKKNLL